ncbi:hypothetical protein WJX72_011245 [[Myrmecia] bisecta]|uniref:Major facilitator superfamily (MFS) profile domain-containing protein n=1 Tax=[Myrmecia] bisecta TaxID=41462 RepID=A0AAW1R979_9CHLO
MRDGEAAREDPKIPTASGVHDVHEEEEQPLPKKQVFAIWLTQTVMGIHITLPFTLAVYMVRSFYDDGNSVNEKTVATLTGLLAATMSGANFLSSFPWGMFSDRFGRKVTVLIGCFASATCMLTLGLSQTYLAAFLSRFFAGFFNGAGVGTNTMIGESLTPVNQALVMGYGNLGWGIGNILGPVVGGYCSVPCETMAPWFPLCGEGQLFKTRPFLLPCLVAGGLALLAFLVNIALMHETHPRLQNRGGHWGATLKSLGGYRRVLQSEQEEIKGDRGKLPAAAELSTGINVHSMHSAPSGTELELVAVESGLHTPVAQFFQELTPVFAAAPQALGGLGMPAYELAFPMSVSGIFLIVFSLLVYPRLVRKLGPLAACKLGMVTGIPPGFIVPSASLLLGFPTLKVAVLCLGLGTRGIAALLSLSSSQILLNALAPRDQIGAVNGVAASMQALIALPVRQPSRVDLEE